MAAAWHQHSCAYYLEQEASSPYLTGSYLCSLCGDRKPSAEICSDPHEETCWIRPDILMEWKLKLSDEILQAEKNHAALRCSMANSGLLTVLSRKAQRSLSKPSLRAGIPSDVSTCMPTFSADLKDF
jgi:hypothetical protein